MTFGDTRHRGPGTVGGDLQVASLQRAQLLHHPGWEFVASGGAAPATTTARRAGHGEDCAGPTPTRPAGAAEVEDFERQQAKIVTAINALGAEVVSLAEIENSAKFGHHRDDALAALVEALNAEPAPAPGPSSPPRPTPGDQADEDVIRTALIYRPAEVAAGRSAR